MEEVNIDTLRIEIEANATNAESSIDKLAQSLTNLKTSISGNLGGRLSKVASGIGEIATQINSIDDTKLNRLYGTLKRINNLKGFKIPKAIGSAIESVVPSHAEETQGVPSGTSRAEEEYRKVGEEAKKTKGKIKDLNNEIGNSGNTARKSAVGGFAKLLQTFKRIALYRAIRFTLMEIKKAITEGVKAVYEFSNAIGGKFGQQVDSLSSSFEGYKVSLGVGLAPLLTSLMPTLEIALKGLTKVNEGLGKVFAFLGDGTYYTVNAEAVGKYSESLKKLKSATLGIDELNILSPEADMSELLKENKLGTYLDLGIGSAGLTIGAGVAGYTALEKIVGQLTKTFQKKNDTLEKQTQKTQKEQIAVNGLSVAFGLALANALGWNKGLEQTEQGLAVVTETMEELKERISSLENNDLADRLAELQNQFDNISETEAFISIQTQVDDLQKQINDLLGIVTEYQEATEKISETEEKVSEKTKKFKTAEIRGWFDYVLSLTSVGRKILELRSVFENFGDWFDGFGDKFTKKLKNLGKAIAVVASVLAIFGGVGVLGTGLIPVGSALIGSGIIGLLGTGIFGSIKPNKNPLKGFSGQVDVGSINGGLVNPQSFGEITEAIYSTSNAQNSLLAEQNDLLKGMQTKGGTSYSNKELFKNVQKGKVEYGAVLTTGGVL